MPVTYAVCTKVWSLNLMGADYSCTKFSPFDPGEWCTKFSISHWVTELIALKYAVRCIARICGDKHPCSRSLKHPELRILRPGESFQHSNIDTTGASRDPSGFCGRKVSSTDCADNERRSAYPPLPTVEMPVMIAFRSLIW